MLSNPDGACELLLLAGQFGLALEQINTRLGKKLRGLTSMSATESLPLQSEIESLTLRGNDAHERYASSGVSIYVIKTECFFEYFHPTFTFFGNKHLQVLG